MQLKINCVLAVTVPDPKPKKPNHKFVAKLAAEGIQKLLNNKVFPEVKDVDLNIRMNMDDIRVAP